MALSIHPVEFRRIASVIDEGVEKLEVLSVMAPEITTHKEELSQLINDEISRIIEEQRNLQSRYEELISERSKLKNLSNKAKHKEIQAEIEQISNKLRFATKILCRNLKENPNIADNILKIQRERGELQKLLEAISVEMKEGSLKTMTETLERERKKKEEIELTRNTVKQLLTDIKKHQDEISDLTEERKRDEVSQNQAIEKLKEDLQELKAKTVLEGKYSKKEARAKLEAARRVYQQNEKLKSQTISKLEKTIDREQSVHTETANFLDRKHEELQRLTEYWDSKHETDIEEKERQLEALKSKKASDLVKLTELRQKFREVQEMVMKEKRLREARSYAREMQQKRNHAATIIQCAWRLYRKRKSAKEKLKKMKKKSKGSETEQKQKMKSTKTKSVKAKEQPAPEPTS